MDFVVQAPAWAGVPHHAHGEIEVGRGGVRLRGWGFGVLGPESLWLALKQSAHKLGGYRVRETCTSLAFLEPTYI